MVDKVHVHMYVCISLMQITNSLDGIDVVVKKEVISQGYTCQYHLMTFPAARLNESHYPVGGDGTPKCRHFWDLERVS